MKNNQRKLNDKGFSLIELIVVIAIMAILVGVMAPNVLRYIEKANEGNDIQTLQAIHTAVYTALIDPNVTGKPEGATYSLPTSATTDDSTFNGAVYSTLGKTASQITFKSDKSGKKTGADVSIGIGTNYAVTVSVGSLGVNNDGTFTPETPAPKEN